MKLGKQFALVSLALAAAVPAFAQFRSGNLSPSLQLLSMPEVRKELKITEAQDAQLTGVRAGSKTSMIAMLRGLGSVPRAERAKKFDSFRSDVDRKLVLILDASQRKRLHELELQRDGMRVLLRPDVGAELRLTPEQHAKLTTVTQQEMGSIRTLYMNSTKTVTPADQEEARNKIKLIQTKTDSDIYDVLTDEQKIRFRVMQGAPFKFPERPSPPIVVTRPGQTPAAVPGAKPVPAAKPALTPKPATKK
jgi:Spy/CpxP family protein refolding chaperone